MERYRGIAQKIEEVRARGAGIAADLLAELYTQERYRAAYFAGENDVPRVIQAVRVFYLTSPGEYKVATVRLDDRYSPEETRETMRSVLSELPGDPLLAKAFLPNLASLVLGENLRTLSALEISNAADNNRRITALYYPKVLTRQFGDDLATVLALSAQQSVSVPESPRFDPNIPMN